VYEVGGIAAYGGRLNRNVNYDQENVMRILKHLVVALLAFSLLACSDKPVSLNKVQLTSNGFTLGDYPAGSIYIGPDQENFLDLTLPLHSFRPGYTITSKANNHWKEVSIAATWDGKYYAPSTKHATNFAVAIKTVSPSERKMTFQVSAKLVNPDPEKYMEFKTGVLEISGKQYDDLMKL